MYGKVITYLESEIQKSILDFKAFMPKKAKRIGCPHFVWIAPSSHSKYKNNNLRRKFANELEIQLRGKPFTTVLRFRQVWEPNNPDLILQSGNELSSIGVYKFWGAVDRSIAFADKLIFGAVHNRSNNCGACRFNNRQQETTRRAYIRPRRRLPAPPHKRN